MWPTRTQKFPESRGADPSGSVTEGTEGLGRNIELKALDPEPARSVAICRDLGAEDGGVLHQVDTYFNARRGRLKLREESPGRAQLIVYERADRPEERVSTYRIAAVSDPAALRDLLGAALGAVVTVEKRRRLFLWRGVRIHLDEVSGLGDFIELEAVAAARSDLLEERERVSELRRRFAITDERLCSTGYAQQLLGGRRDDR